MPELESSLAQLTTRYTLALDMIGEKEDELNELRNDLTHVKEIFRQQMSAVLQNNNTINTNNSKSAAPAPAPAASIGGGASASAHVNAK